MLAVAKTERGEGHIELVVRPTPEPPPGWVRIAVTYAGICGTDLHILHDRFPSWPPVTLGHEFVGRVDALGDLVDPGWLGARVVSEPHALACGTCHLCRRGIAELCPSKRSPGWGIDGAFCASLVMPAHLLHRVPEGVPDRVAALTEPMAITVTALLRARVDPGDTVLVVGAGPVGILAAVAARAMGAGRVSVAGRAGSERLAFAATLGFRVTDGHTSDEAVREVTDGRGADLVVDASGTVDGIALAIGAAKRRGRMVAVGLSGTPGLVVPWDGAVSRALDLTFSMSSSSTAWDPAIGILADTGSSLVPMTTVFPLADWSAAFDAVAARTVIKALLDPAGT
jgi:L-iditol 2-dehydrogenase